VEGSTAESFRHVRELFVQRFDELGWIEGQFADNRRPAARAYPQLSEFGTLLVM
jgi:hypothetical protein